MAQPKQHHIAFLHTGRAHIATFQTLMEELAPELSVHHTVNESLLLHAQQFGEDEALFNNVKDALLAVTNDAVLTVCTCSSIGSAAEQVAHSHGQNIMRIDRAMADIAAQQPRILVLAALESTLKPTRSLLETSAKNHACSPEICYRVVENAWLYFLAGDTDCYNRLISKAVDEQSAGYDVVVLAQASMAGAERLTTTTTPIHSSPRLGVQAAINLFHKLGKPV
ncbi:hypothetical protein [Reinekea marinisedimentorum]|uniref:Asp/Glu/hydantoin racemase n=1 Tax=Reinekea marinisedimentorum TaxID=230495 RepID=A0A4R3ICI3_9GAMM|nr:hypothetical protein [Reinekea marinisedimentorum]TCS43276.1 hypothetical protein BCF53_102302 [Reinekea marinisedimentorum]